MAFFCYDGFLLNFKIMNKLSHKNSFNKVIKLIDNCIAQNKIAEAIGHLLTAHKMEPKNHAILNELGTCYSKVEDFKTALDYHLKAHYLIENNSIIIANIGIDLLRLENFEEAIEIFNEAIRIDEKNFIALNGLNEAYNSIGDYINLCNNSIKGITLYPSKYEFHLNLGLALIGLNNLDEARYSTETALTLNPNCYEAKLNIATILGAQQQSFKAIEIYENILLDSNNLSSRLLSSIKYNLSYEYLNLGKIKQGWDFYDNGLDKTITYSKRRRPDRSFLVPKWEGHELNDETLMVWGEQGVGDEILFLSLIPDLLLKAKSIILETEPRLLEIAKRSFPSIEVRAYSFSIDGNQTNFDYNYHIPIGSLNKFLRKSLSDYENKTPYLVPCTDNKHIFNDLIDSNSSKTIIGLCWRSGLMNIERSVNYIPLDQWGEIFSIPNAIFINLQYGDCEAELINAEEKFNIKIHRWSDIDLKNDLDTVFSLISKLDLVVTAATAVSSMSFSIGTKTLTFYAGRYWANLGTDYYPWSCFNTPFFPEESNNLPKVLKNIASYIMETYVKET